jgi:hypothetical protein
MIVVAQLFEEASAKVSSPDIRDLLMESAASS